MITEQHARWERWGDWIVRVLRWVLTIALIYGAYTETGHWTTVCLVGIFLYVEAETFRQLMVRRAEEAERELERMIDGLLNKTADRG